MTTFAGVEFECLTLDGFRPEWEQEPNIARRHIPYSNSDDVQHAGRGNYRMVIPAKLTSDADLATLRAAVGITPRTLGDYFGADYAGTMLTAVRSPRRVAWRAIWFVELEFEREGA